MLQLAPAMKPIKLHGHRLKPVNCVIARLIVKADHLVSEIMLMML